MEKSHYCARGVYFKNTRHGGGKIRSNYLSEMFNWFFGYTFGRVRTRELANASKIAKETRQSKRASISLLWNKDVLEMDAWAFKEGGKRNPFGANSALAHYIGRLPVEDIVIVHKDFSPTTPFFLFGLRALSKILCLSSIGNTIKEEVSINKTLAISVFGSGFRGKVLAHIGIGRAAGYDGPELMTPSLLYGELPNAKLRLVEKLLQSS